jgi:hypothetical protein
MTWTSFAQKKIGDAMLGDAAFPTLTGMWLALLASNPGENGSLASEVALTRQRMDTAMAAFSSTLGTTSNTSAITYPVPASTLTFSHVAMVDAATGGNAWWYEALPFPITKNSGEVAPSFQAGAVTIAIALDSLTAYAAKTIGDAILAKATFPTIAAMYQGLFTGNPTSAGLTASEVFGGGYARQNVSAALPAIDAASGVTQSSGLLVYPTPTGPWGNVAYVGWMDALAGGNMWARDQLPTQRSLIAGSAPPQFPAGSILFQLD